MNVTCVDLWIKPWNKLILIKYSFDKAANKQKNTSYTLLVNTPPRSDLSDTNISSGITLLYLCEQQRSFTPEH